MKKLLLIALLIVGCDNSTEATDINPCADCGDLECCDCDGNIYETIQIGDQIWMAENLKVIHYNDGSEIPNITNNGE